jgi:hypothetical protein
MGLRGQAGPGMSNLRSRESYAAAAVDWEVLSGCFGETQIRPADIDGMVERNGHFLFLEGKPVGLVFGGGQKLALTRLSSQPKTYVIVFYGHPPEEEIARIETAYQGEWTQQRSPSLSTLRHLCQRWYEWANRSGRPR